MTLRADGGGSAASLAEVYRTLGFDEGQLYEARTSPGASPARDAWAEVGDWLTLAERMGADRMFFVNGDPVVVFKTLPDAAEDTLLTAYRQAWCMAGPQCLFVATPDGLSVYALTAPPPRPGEPSAALSPLAVVRRSADVAEELQRFARTEIESGRLFGDERFGDQTTRADRRLIKDLQAVRAALLGAGLEPQYAHALIGRSIFIRYLEDREVLTRAYFDRVAAGRDDWRRLLDEALERPDVNPAAHATWYARVLADRAFTFALFDQLIRDFNGDMFPYDRQERDATKDDHLRLLRRLLLSDTEPDQPPLFFWAYDFSIIPISLISSIYEEFYHAGNRKDAPDPGVDESDAEDDAGGGADARAPAREDNTHYTPATLVDDVLRRVLTPDRLARRPRVLDPACGSGIFLVEAFRRVVRYETARRGRRLASEELREILRTQIVGVEQNSEATRVAAFSLYLALLNYQDPPDIASGPPLPKLIHTEHDDARAERTLFTADAFSLTDEERRTLSARIGERARFRGRAELVRLRDRAGRLPLAMGSLDVIVGNPPWQEAGARSLAAAWAGAFGYPVGDTSYSQLFLARAFSLVAADGAVGLLVHASVLTNRRPTSFAFRRWWLGRVVLHEVVNYTHARYVFFDRGSAPFVFAHWSPAADTPMASNDQADATVADASREAEADAVGEAAAAETDAPVADAIAGHLVMYASARVTRTAERLRSVTLLPSDRRLVPQHRLLAHDELWKVYSWGGHRDAALIARLQRERPLRRWVPRNGPEPAYGFQNAHGRPGRPPQGVLARAPQLRSRMMRSFGPRDPAWLAPAPTAVGQAAQDHLFAGQRLLASRGVKQEDFALAVRLETAELSFRHAVLGVPLPDTPPWRARAYLGVLWSSLARYYQFMTSGAWGVWHDSVTKEEFLATPIRVAPARSDLQRRIDHLVVALQRWSPGDDLFGAAPATSPGGDPRPAELLAQLDDAVFDLFEFTDDERALVREQLTIATEYLKHGIDASVLGRATLPPATSGLAADLDLPSSADRAAVGSLPAYLQTLLAVWNPEVAPHDVEFRWRVVRPSGVNVLAVVLEPVSRFDPGTPVTDTDELTREVARLGRALPTPLSRRLFTEGVVRAVADSGIVIVRRDERRLWSRTTAREDADATMLQVMRLHDARADERPTIDAALGGRATTSSPSV